MPAAVQRRYAKEYETIYIMTPNVDTDEAGKVANRLSEVVTRLDGKMTKVESWGRRKLAYPIRKSSRGVFVYLKYVGYGDMVAELERNLRMFDSVVRFQTVMLRDEVQLTDVAVDPEEVKFRAWEAGEEEPEMTLEERLGLNVADRYSRAAEVEGDAVEEAPAEAEAPEAAQATPGAEKEGE